MRLIRSADASAHGLHVAFPARGLRFVQAMHIPFAAARARCCRFRSAASAITAPSP
jgi:hypothetical protein